MRKYTHEILFRHSVPVVRTIRARDLQEAVIKARQRVPDHRAIVSGDGHWVELDGTMVVQGSNPACHLW